MSLKHTESGCCLQRIRRLEGLDQMIDSPCIDNPLIGCMSLIPEMMKQRRCDIDHVDDIAPKSLKLVQESH